MHIYSVNDPEFKSYGNVWDDVPSELTSPVLEALSATPIPEGSKYVASAPGSSRASRINWAFSCLVAVLPARLVQRPQHASQLPGVSPRE